MALSGVAREVSQLNVDLRIISTLGQRDDVVNGRGLEVRHHQRHVDLVPAQSANVTIARSDLPQGVRLTGCCVQPSPVPGSLPLLTELLRIGQTLITPMPHLRDFSCTNFTDLRPAKQPPHLRPISVLLTPISDLGLFFQTRGDIHLNPNRPGPNHVPIKPGWSYWSRTFPPCTKLPAAGPTACLLIIMRGVINLAADLARPAQSRHLRYRNPCLYPDHVKPEFCHCM